MWNWGSVALVLEKNWGPNQNWGWKKTDVHPKGFSPPIFGSHTSFIHSRV
jgi:hypothetical protein